MSDLSLQTEQRRSPRFPFREPLEFRVRSLARGVPAKKVSLGSLAWDLSDSGIRFRSEDFLPLGTSLSFLIPLETDEAVEVEGWVAWITQVPYSEHYQVGVAFTDRDIDQLNRRRLRQFLPGPRARGVGKES